MLGWLSFSLNRDELERTVGGAHQATAVAAARACERWLAQSLEALQLSLANKSAKAIRQIRKTEQLA